MLLFLILLFFGSRLTPYLCLLKWCFCFNLFFTLISLKYLMLLYKPKRYRNTLLNNVFAIINTKQFRDRGIVYKIHRFFNLGTLTIYSK